MNGFLLIPPRDYVGELLAMVPRFAESEEYKSLDGTDRTLAGLVFSAFARFLERSFANQVIINECRKASEHFAEANDSNAHNLLVTEVFEGFRNPDVARKLLLPASRALYDRWIGAP